MLRPHPQTEKTTHKNSPLMRAVGRQTQTAKEVNPRSLETAKRSLSFWSPRHQREGFHHPPLPKPNPTQTGATLAKTL